MCKGIRREIEYSENWITVIKNIWQVGDLVTCPTEQSISINGKQISLGIALSQASETPVLMFEGYYHETDLRLRTRIAEIKWWGIALLIVVLSSYFQNLIFRTIKGWTNPILLCLTVVIELSLIWIWNRSG